MLHSSPAAQGQPSAAVSAIAIQTPPKALVPFLPRGAKPQPRPHRPAFMTRRYEISWLDAEGNVDSGTRLAPALPEFEEAFSAIARGTLIETEEGFVAIEDLLPGTRVLTADGRHERVVWIGTMTLLPPHAVPGVEPQSMTRITAEAFGEGRPMPDLMLGPQARLAMRGGRWARAGADRTSVPAKCLIDGEAIVAVTPVAPIAVYHVVLESHGALRCAGVEVEAYHPGRNAAARLDSQMAQLFIALFPMMKSLSDFGLPAYPRLSSDEAEEMMAA